jgi:hypothetical protein
MSSDNCCFLGVGTAYFTYFGESGSGYGYNYGHNYGGSSSAVIPQEAIKLGIVSDLRIIRDEEIIQNLVPDYSGIARKISACSLVVRKPTRVSITLNCLSTDNLKLLTSATVRNETLTPVDARIYPDLATIKANTAYHLSLKFGTINTATVLVERFNSSDILQQTYASTAYVLTSTKIEFNSGFAIGATDYIRVRFSFTAGATNEIFEAETAGPKIATLYFTGLNLANDSKAVGIKLNKIRLKIDSELPIINEAMNFSSYKISGFLEKDETVTDSTLSQYWSWWRE